MQMKSNGSILVFLLLLAQLCPPAEASARQPDAATAQHSRSGRLTQGNYDSLRQLLRSYSGLPLRDTIILQYVSNGNRYYQDWLAENDEKIQQNVTAELKMLHQAQVERKKITVIHLAEPGGLADSLQQYNNLVNQDISGRVKTLLFGKQSCSNAVIILPDRQYIYMDTPDGWAALQLNNKRIQYLLMQNVAAIP